MFKYHLTWDCTSLCVALPIETLCQPSWIYSGKYTSSVLIPSLSPASLISYISWWSALNVLLQARGPWVSGRSSTCTGSSDCYTGNAILRRLTSFTEIHHLAKSRLDHLTTTCAVALKSTVNSKQEKKTVPRQSGGIISCWSYAANKLQWKSL